MAARRPTVAVWKFASCDGCQLSLLDCEQELLAVADRVDLRWFLEAGLDDGGTGTYDLSLVEGSVTTPGDAERIQEIRRQSRILVTIGACATSGGIQALRNFSDVEQFLTQVYAHPAYVATLDRSTPISAHVTVDVELSGCPVDKGELLEVVQALVQGRMPRLHSYSVCVECKRRGVVCVAVSSGMPCLGPVTRAGCGALCPRFARGCFGCFGPQDTPNTASLADHMRREGSSRRQLVRRFRHVAAGAEPFRREGHRHEEEV